MGANREYTGAHEENISNSHDVPLDHSFVCPGVLLARSGAGDAGSDWYANRHTPGFHAAGVGTQRAGSVPIVHA